MQLAERLAGAHNLSVAVKENEQDGVVFMYKVVEGCVDKSYGIEVAKLAGLPQDVVSRARGVLKELEEKQIKKSPVNPDQINMFELESRAREHAKLEKNDGVMNKLKELDLNQMTPMQAMQKLDEIKKNLL